MTNEQLENFKELRTVKERAAFLLAIGVNAKTNIKDLNLVMQACVGDILLPVTGETEQEAIEKGIAWLKEKLA
jgi:hypothetical protein